MKVESKEKDETKFIDITHLQPLQSDAVFKGVGWNRFNEIMADIQSYHFIQIFEVFLRNSPHRTRVGAINEQVGKTFGDFHRQKVNFLAAPEAKSGGRFSSRRD